MSLEALFLENGISYLKCQSRIKWTENNGKIKIDIPLSIPILGGKNWWIMRGFLKSVSNMNHLSNSDIIHLLYKPLNKLFTAHG